ncbi:hypothetical protein [Methylobacter sp. BBA5.1]|uniref:hypothetical protein n=1 Tax=Methylobacter sp. BBA5.1 TaxID=1495064 RepID=UPI001F31A748|nr:hypothetical protein [Methylobacter sp. BBA5.1]
MPVLYIQSADALLFSCQRFADTRLADQFGIQLSHCSRQRLTAASFRFGTLNS